MAGEYRFSFGPWNIHEGADPFGPPVRPTIEFATKLALYKKLGFDAVQFHDDDAVADVDEKSPDQSGNVDRAKVPCSVPFRHSDDPLTATVSISTAMPPTA